MEINWNDLNARISPNFSVHEALWLPSWGRHATPEERMGFEGNMVALAHKMEAVRDLFAAPIKVHCWLRPTAYNKEVGGARSSAHLVGRAVDFHVDGFEGAGGCLRARGIILPHLEALGLRMENHEGGWVHIDSAPVGPSGNRYFLP